MTLPPGLRARVLEDAKRNPKPAPKGLGRPIVLVGSVVWVVLSGVLHGARDNWHELPTAAAWVPLAELVVASALATAVAIAQGAFMVGPPVRRALAVLAIPVVAAATLLLLVPNLRPTPTGAFFATTLPCDAGITMVAVPVLALLVFAQHGRVLTSPRLVGAVAGIAAATWGHAILHWGCPFTDAGHIFWGHVVPSVPLAVFGAYLSDRFQKAPPSVTPKNDAGH